MMGFGGVLKVWLVVSLTLSAIIQVTATELLRCAETGTVLLVLWTNGTLEACIEFESSVCSGQGERVWAKPDGGWECGCRDGWGRKRGEGECQQLGAACGQQGR